MVSAGDKQPLTAAEGGSQMPEGLVERTRRSLSAVLGDKKHKTTGRNSQGNNELQGWQNPSYEMTEMEQSKEVEVKEADVDDGNVESGKRVKKTDRHASKGRRKDRERRKRPDVLVEEHEMEERPGKSVSADPGASLRVVDETAAGQGDGPANPGEPPSRPPRRPGRRGRKKAHVPSDQQAAELAETHGVPHTAEEGGGEPAAAADQVLGVLVHQADRLDGASWHLSRPMVRVQLVDDATGQPVRKCDPHRHVTYFYEPDGVETILPALTQPGTAIGGGLITWDDLLLFNEPVSRLTADEPRVCLLFELTTARPELSTTAWAFLRLRSAAPGGRLNTERRLRLQLYRPPGDRAARTTPALNWWRSGGRRHRLAATLHVTVSALLPPALEPGRRSLYPTQPEEAAGAAASPEPGARRPSSPLLPTWSRLSGQQCRLPNTRRATLADDCESCQTLRFDGSGQRLACAVQRAAQFPVLVYQVASGQRSHALLGHAGLVYDLRWADDRLVTASADWTARLWHLNEAGRYTALVLPHPGYVYSALFHLTAPQFLVTGCFDGVVRLWESGVRDAPGAEPRLADELVAGETPVNSLCCSADGRRLYAGDARGRLSVWSWREVGGRPQVTLERRLAPEEVGGAPIDHLELHPAGRRLLVQARRGVIAVLDTDHLVTLRTLGGHLHSRTLVRGAVTPCGTYYLCGAEDGCLHVWALDSGERCATYTALGGTRPVVGVHFHPWEHMTAVASHRDPRVTVQLIQHERQADGEQLGLSLLPRAIQPAPTDDFTAPPLTPPPARDEPPEDEHENRRFQAILDRLDSVIEVARGGPAGGRLSETVLSAPAGLATSEGDGELPAVHRSRHRRRRREQKQRDALSRTDPGV
ncbi:Jouberin [Amphibalanus amphitrite]|uniref:Jouberin n=1 Tax=Amphibalanus amphitrite TaxID=1232801 RepID=A0A6A4VUD1_AMPAM|nr:jouberin-like [Amphibalanus amphitrite]XP_043205040.1 jouberin-like [Amphibalanus amphitrite]KAF0292991.1 Jouberin [Amphibalanus amphitrite]